MALYSTMYGPHVFTDPFRNYGRWTVTGTMVLADSVEHLIEEGLSPEEIVCSGIGLRQTDLPTIVEIHRIHTAYLTRIGRPVAA